MAYARDVFTGTGSPQTLAVSFPVLQRSHIEVLVDDALQVEGVGYTFVTDTSISITAPAASEIVIQRNTSRGARLTNYIDGTNLGQAPLNSDSKQAFYMAQEALDGGAENAAAINDLEGVVADHETRLDNAEAAITALQANDADILPRLTAAESDIDGLQASMVGALDSINTLQAADVALDARIDALESGSGVTDHGALTGLSDNDHPQYALAAALGTAAYVNTSAFAANLHDHDAADINSGVLDPARIPDITAAKVDSGVVPDGHVLTADGAGGAAWEAPAGGGVTDHGALTGLADDDHPQYLNESRGDARYATVSHTHNGIKFTFGIAFPTVGNTPGDRFFNSDTGKEYTWVDDGSSTQWVELYAGGGGSSIPLPVAIESGGTGQNNAAAAINALLPAQAGNNGKVLQTNGSTAAWATVLAAIAGATMTAWTPTDASGAGLTLTPTECKYMRFGELVFIMGRVGWPVNASGLGARITTPLPVAAGYPEGVGMVWFNADVNQIVVVDDTTDHIRFNLNNNYKTNADLSASILSFVGMYRTTV